jgi:hypothetical protein
MGIRAVVDVMDTPTWEKGFSVLVAGASEVGNPTSSGRSHLEALRRLPPQGERMLLIWQHAAAALLSRILKGQVPYKPIMVIIMMIMMITLFQAGD